MRLETKRLILRQLNKKDINDLVEGINNLEVSKWLAHAPYPYTKKDAIKFIKRSIKNSKQKEKTRFSFAIELKSEVVFNKFLIISSLENFGLNGSKMNPKDIISTLFFFKWTNSKSG